MYDEQVVAIPWFVCQPQALVNGLFPVQAEKLWFNYIIPPLSVQTLLTAKYFVLNLAF